VIVHNTVLKTLLSPQLLFLMDLIFTELLTKKCMFVFL